MIKEKIQFGSKEISFDVVFADRKTLGISVNPNQSVLVKAPNGASLDNIKQKIKKRAPWILKQQSFFLAFEPLTPPRQFISGETHFYLGRRYRLKIMNATKNSVKLKRGFLEVLTNQYNHSEQTKKLVTDWYRKHAQIKFNEYAAPFIRKFKNYGVEPLSIELKTMTRRWGSCTLKRRIILNPELIKAPKGCIEYVIVHELCHLIHPNHSKAFFELQTKEMPDWKKWKDRLEKILA